MVVVLHRLPRPPQHPPHAPGNTNHLRKPWIPKVPEIGRSGVLRNRLSTRQNARGVGRDDPGRTLFELHAVARRTVWRGMDSTSPSPRSARAHLVFCFFPIGPTSPSTPGCCPSMSCRPPRLRAPVLGWIIREPRHAFALRLGECAVDPRPVRDGLWRDAEYGLTRRLRRLRLDGVLSYPTSENVP